MDRVRIAIVGCGSIFPLNSRGYLQHPRCDVVALCDTDAEKAQRRAQESGITPKIYTRFEDVLADPDIDAVELLTPVFLHAEQIIAALAAGKHVSCQKPLAISVAEADRIVEAASKAKTTFRMTENFIYYPPIMKAKELIDAGAIGEPTLVRMHTTKVHQVTDLQMKYDPTAVLWRTNSELTPAGMFWEDGVHKYATAMYWVGEIGPLSAIIGKTEDPTIDLPSAAMWRFKDRDCLGIFDYTLAAEMTMRARFARVDDFFEIHGSKGIIWVTRCSGEMLDMAPVILHRGTESTNYQVPMDWLLSFDGAAKDFVDGLIEGRQPQLDAKAARHVLQASFAAYESARQGRPVDPSELS